MNNSSTSTNETDDDSGHSNDKIGIDGFKTEYTVYEDEDYVAASQALMILSPITGCDHDDEQERTELKERKFVCEDKLSDESASVGDFGSDCDENVELKHKIVMIAVVLVAKI